VTETALALVPVWGVWLVAVATFASCLAMPIPSSLIMLAAGGFVASGDLTGWQVATAALMGAVLGDQTGFVLGRAGGAPLVARLRRTPRRAALITDAEAMIARHGGIGVFLTRWLMSPLGPYVNFLAGAARMDHGRFTVSGIAGETVWVAIYVGLGFVFADRIVALGQLLGNLSGLLAAGAVTIVLGIWMLRLVSRGSGRRREPLDKG
jgi:membrane-associated protein